MNVKYYLLIVISVIISGCAQVDQPTQLVDSLEKKHNPQLNEKSMININERQNKLKHISGIDPDTAHYIVDNPDSLAVYLNKNRRLPEGYVPEDLLDPNVSHLAPKGDDKRLLRAEAASALEDLFSAATEDDVHFAAVSGYRTHDRQATLFQNSVSRNGRAHAEQYSAQPGTSEHETGLAMDVSAAVVAFALEQAFQETTEGRWLADHAHDFGFIIRYPEGKEHITGYAFEPWHIRYVGKELAAHLYRESLTLEEYFGYHYEHDHDTEK